MAVITFFLVSLLNAGGEEPMIGAGLSEAEWPPITCEQRAGAYWWWMGSAADEKNITRQLELYKAAGMGGVHIIPIYGAKGYEDRYVEYLSPRWLELLNHAVAEGKRLGLWVDMTTGTGWCFGGPNITPDLACAAVQLQTQEMRGDAVFHLEPVPGLLQTVTTFNNDGLAVNLTGQVTKEGKLDWTAPPGAWKVYAVFQKPADRMVKRSAPGGAGHMLNPFYGEAVQQYLKRFDTAFSGYQGLMPRAMYHDSYEYQSDWSPDLLQAFEIGRGYRLQDYLPVFFEGGDPDLASRIKCDYRETLSDMMVDNFIRPWTAWANQKGCVTRNQAHGSPGNLLDLYAAADIPETEMFNKDRNPLVSKFASSAAHVTGKVKVASETGTWLKEHFNETLADMKDLVDELFVSGVNHVVYHGTCYSPEDAPWPGWLFYASTQMNPRNSFWRDVPALNEYIARCQAVLQTGRSDNDILVYWPIHDVWHTPEGRVIQMTVHKTEWLTKQPIGNVAQELWQRGYAFDYVSDRMLEQARAANGLVMMPGGEYRILLMPPCQHIPVRTMEIVLQLAEQGATVVFTKKIPEDVPGLGKLEERRTALQALTAMLQWNESHDEARLGRGMVLLTKTVDTCLENAGIIREGMMDTPGIQFIRRCDEKGRYYFISNRGVLKENAGKDSPLDQWLILATPSKSSVIVEDKTTVLENGRITTSFEGWLPLAGVVKSAVLMDPMTGAIGKADLRAVSDQKTDVYLSLECGQSIIVRTFNEHESQKPKWTYWEKAGEPAEVKGTWNIQFIEGGSELPPPIQTDRLDSWTELGGDKAKRFAGTARYALNFDCPGDVASGWRLDLGHVAETARVRLNGQDLGVLICPPFWVNVPSGLMKSQGNSLEVEITNLCANRIRDLDRRGVEWRKFYDINLVNLDYKPFDASRWPLRPSGLLGPVTLTALQEKLVDARGGML
ncbi:MAG TPA: glycosyl hydrolase [Candidatus Hydrogenedentes bacterium]|nr:glycosyl hydrolase [Candidatus Hydrogenedentota bacterium]